MPPHATIVVTGASGFLAKHIIIDLLNQGYAVRATLRTVSKQAHLKSLLSLYASTDHLSFHEADLVSDLGWDEAFQGANGFIHVASPFPSGPVKDRQSLIKPAVEGTQRVLNAAHTAGVYRGVVTSSVVAIAYGHAKDHRLPYTEDDWTNIADPQLGAYHESKTRAEQRVWDFAQQYPKMKLATVNPGVILGPVLDRDIGTSVGIIRNLLTGKTPALPRIGFEIVDVRDVSDLHIRALTQDLAIGHRHVCTSGYMWMSEIAALLSKRYPRLARKVTRIEVPDFVVRLLANFDPEVALALPELGRYWPCASVRAMALGWTPRSPEEAISATTDGLRAVGLL